MRREWERWSLGPCLMDLGRSKDKAELSFATLCKSKGLFIFLVLSIKDLFIG